MKSIRLIILILDLLAAGVHAATVTLSGAVQLTPGVIYDDVKGVNAADFYSLAPGTTIVGRTDPAQPMPVLVIPSSSQGYAFKLHQNGVKLKGFRLRGGGIFIEGPNGLCDGLEVDDVEFETVIGPGAKQCALEFSCRVQNFKITRCLYIGNAKWGVFNGNFGGDNGLIANNEFIGIASGLHFDGPGSAVTIEQNYGEGIAGAMIEAQGSAAGMIIQDNDYAKPNTTVNGSKYFISAPLADGSNAVIRRNRAIGPTWGQVAPGQEPTRIVFELGGKNLTAEDNFSNGGNDVCAVNGSKATGKVQNNRFANFDHATGNNNGSTATLANNGPNTVLTWDIARPRPSRFSRYVSTPPGYVAPPTTQFVDDPVISSVVTQKSGKTTTLHP